MVLSPSSPPPKLTLQALLSASERVNTQRSYAAALRHFEQEWQGFLPATQSSIAQYLADHAEQLSIATLTQRLAALSHWHTQHGFADPTKAVMVRKVLRGIRATTQAHPPKQARPLSLALLEQVDAYLLAQLHRTDVCHPSKGIERAVLLRHRRDRAMLLLGFWRGFRSDEITRLRVQDITLEPGKGLSCYLPQSKADRKNLGRTFQCPALSRLCPVQAMQEWLQHSGLLQLSDQSTPLFSAIDRWGHVSHRGLAASSIAPWLQRLLHDSGVAQSQHFSSHSLRRGFANWARDAGWDMRELMGYVGWRDIKSALRYVDGPAPHRLQERFEQALQTPTPPPP